MSTVTFKLKWTYAHLEILNHHLTHGVVWDGDQISKRYRDDLRDLGLLRRVEGTGYHALTMRGAQMALQNRALFWAWSRIKHLPIGLRARNAVRSVMPKLVRATFPTQPA